ncbi:hypothetical protein KRR26_08850 [Corallococcus sp. M34]|uniref:ABC transporter permease/M1 family aminopeptidase n=1 Tax=Citreicoccus inhibens TaxID=2849499 RepID=UPI001C214FAC|nr:M1 family aminopeptidase [Citreicoccus inhibens]MBU8895711.1 hypothetical protein [Citreicoccus inhibens]
MNRSRLGTVLRTELGHQMRRPLYWILIVLAFLVVWGVSSGNVTIDSGASQVGGKKAWATSEFAVSQMVVFLTFLLQSFFVSVGAGMSVISDEEARVQPLLHSSPLTPGEYVWGKFLAVVLAYAVSLCATVGFLMFFHHVVPAGEAAEFRGPFILSAYLRPVLWFGLPLLVVMTGAAFAMGEATRRPVLVYFLPVGLFFLCIFFLWDWSPGWLDPRINRVLMAVEPAGFRWLSETWLKVDRGVDFYNTQPVGLDALFVISRGVLVGLGLGAVAWSQRHFARALRGQVAVRVPRLAQAEALTGSARHGAAGRVEGAPLASLGMGARPPSILLGMWHVARAEVRGLLSQPGLYLFVPIILFQTVVTALSAVGPFDTPLLLTPGRFALRMSNEATVLVCLLLLFYTVESLEREAASGFSPIHSATPVRTLSVLAGKAIANSVVGVAMLGALSLAGVVVQGVQGTVSLSLMPYVMVWGLLLVPTFVLWTSFVLAARALAGGRFGAYGLALGALGLTGFGAAREKLTWVTNWPMWSTVRWSDMGPLELDRPAVVLNRLAALGMAVFFTALAVRLDARRARDSVSLLEQVRPSGLLRGARRLAPFAVFPGAVLLLLGLRVGEGFEGDAAKKRAKEYWQKNLATWKDAPQPALVDVELSVDLEPASGALRTRGTYTLINRHAQPLERFALSGGDHWQDVRWTVEGQEATPEDRSRLYVFTPAHPLATGATTKVGFEFHGVFPQGVSRNGGERSEFILPSGVVLTSEFPTFAPVVGYLETVGVDKKENQYEPRVYSDHFYEGLTTAGWGTGKPFTTRIQITGPAEYTFNSVGTLTSDDVKDGRRVMVWTSDQPVSMFNIVAGRWSAAKGDGTVVFHHPAHGYNVARMVRGLDAARKYYSEWFYPYPWKELKLSEFPGIATYAQGFPTNITFSESIGFLARASPRADAVLLVTAHEAAHQWWGNLLIPGKGPGGNVLSEGMSHYSALRLIEQLEGSYERMETARRLEDRYGKSRRVDGEQPLVKLDDSREGDNTVLYDKGGWTFWMLEDLMGRPAMQAGLQAFLRHYIPDEDHPVLQDFLAELRPFAPDAAAFDAFAQQWFFQVSVPEYHLSEPRVTADGAKWVTKVVVRNTGTGRMPVEIAVAKGERFPERDDATGPVQPSPDYRDARETRVLGPDEQVEVTLRSDFKPEQILVDPDVRVLQLRRAQALLKL